jgi:hypothetical protein
MIDRLARDHPAARDADEPKGGHQIEHRHRREQPARKTRRQRRRRIAKVVEGLVASQASGQTGLTDGAQGEGGDGGCKHRGRHADDSLRAGHQPEPWQQRHGEAGQRNASRGECDQLALAPGRVDQGAGRHLTEHGGGAHHRHHQADALLIPVLHGQ